MLLTALTVLLNLVLLYTRVFASSQRLEEVLLTEERDGIDIPKSAQKQSETSKLQKNEFQNSIEFKNVSFAFPDSSELLFDDLSFSLPVGKSLSIIGPTGSGKSS